MVEALKSVKSLLTVCVERDNGWVISKNRLVPKTTLGVNFINILRATIVPIFLSQKLQRTWLGWILVKFTKPKHEKKKAAQSTFVQKFHA